MRSLHSPLCLRERGKGQEPRAPCPLASVSSFLGAPLSLPLGVRKGSIYSREGFLGPHRLPCPDALLCVPETGRHLILTALALRGQVAMTQFRRGHGGMKQYREREQRDLRPVMALPCACHFLSLNLAFLIWTSIAELWWGLTAVMNVKSLAGTKNDQFPYRPCPPPWSGLLSSAYSPLSSATDHAHVQSERRGVL